MDFQKTAFYRLVYLHEILSIFIKSPDFKEIKEITDFNQEPYTVCSFFTENCLFSRDNLLDINQISKELYRSVHLCGKLHIFIKLLDFNEIKDIKEIRDFLPDFKREPFTVCCTCLKYYQND